MLFQSLVTQALGTQPTTSTQFLVQDFAVIMIVASIMLLITYKLKQPMVIGYLVAGMIIGPYTPPFGLIHEVNILNNLAELGIIILMFVICNWYRVSNCEAPVCWQDFNHHGTC